MASATAKKFAAQSNNHVAPTIKAQDKFASARKAMQSALVERDQEIDLVLSSLIAQEHCLLVGPPGTAKSLVIESVRQWIDGAKSLTIHCCKDTTRNVAFGPVKLTSLKQDRTERNLEGGAADCHLLLLEEVFKSGPAVLDMFLMLMNERTYREGLVSAKCPLRLLMGVSNEWSPEGCETALAAFFDRFLFRKEVKSVSPKAGRKELLKRAVDGNNCHTVFPERITLSEIDIAHQEAMSLPITSEAKKAIWEIMEACNKEGIFVGDRRTMKAIKAVRAFAILDGAKEVGVNHLEILSHVLWESPQEQPKKVSQIVAKIANPIGHLVNEKLIQVEDVLAGEKPIEAIPKLQDMWDEISKLPVCPSRDKALDYITECIKVTHAKIVRIRPGVNS